MLESTREEPINDERKFWWNKAVNRKDWYLLIVQDQIDGLEYPIFVRQFDDYKYHYHKHHHQNDQFVLAVYATG